jgi:hypothetical protein
VSEDAIIGAISEEYQSQFGILGVMKESIQTGIRSLQRQAGWKISSDYDPRSLPGSWLGSGPERNAGHLIDMSLDRGMHDVGPGNIRLKYAKQLVEYYGPMTGAAGASDDQLESYLETPDGAIRMAAIALLEAQSQLRVGLGDAWLSMSPLAQDAYAIEYYNQGPSYVDRAAAAIENGRVPTVGDAGTFFLDNLSPLRAAYLRGLERGR